MLGVDPVEVSGGRGEIAMWGLMAMETICVVWVVRLMEVRARGKVIVLGKFGLVRFEALFAKPETKLFGFSQIFRNQNRNRIKPFDAVSNGFKPGLN